MKEDRFEFFKDEHGKYRWRRIAPNGRIVGSSSQGYRTLWGCKKNARREGWANV